MTEQSNNQWELKSRGAGILVFLVLIFAGALIGLLLQKLIAPDSKAANAISVAMLPISVVLGAMIWQVLIIIYIGMKIGRATLKGFKKGGIKAAFQQKIEGFPPFPPRTFVFVVVSSMICLIAGVAVAFVPEVASFFGTITLYLIIGMIYGFIQRHLVRAGYIVMFESEGVAPVPDKGKDKIG